MAALTLTGGATIVADDTFQERVAMAFYFVARQVFSESPSTSGHENRARFAYSITRQPYEAFLQYAAMVVTDSAIVAAGPATQAAVTDAQILAAVTSMWDVLSNSAGT